MIHGNQILPWGDIEALTNVQRVLGCDILLSGHTHQNSIQAKDKIFYINHGSTSDAFSQLITDPSPVLYLLCYKGKKPVLIYMNLMTRPKNSN